MANPFDQFDPAAASAGVALVAVALMVPMNVWLVRRLIQALAAGGRSNRREGAVRIFVVCVFAVQVLGVATSAVGVLTKGKHALEMSGFWLTVAPALYGLGVLFAWIVDGFTGRQRVVSQVF